MRNIPSALLIIAFVYFSSLGFHWYYSLLLIGVLMFWEYPVKENIEMLKAQIEEVKARTQSIIWSTELSKSQVKVNMAMIEKMRRR